MLVKIGKYLGFCAYLRFYHGIYYKAPRDIKGKKRRKKEKIKQKRLAGTAAVAAAAAG